MPTALFRRWRGPFDCEAAAPGAFVPLCAPDPHSRDLLEPEIDERLRRISIEHHHKEKQTNVTRCLHRNRLRKEPRPDIRLFGYNLPYPSDKHHTHNR